MSAYLLYRRRITVTPPILDAPALVMPMSP
jgi:hypothetical protein